MGGRATRCESVLSSRAIRRRFAVAILGTLLVAACGAERPFVSMVGTPFQPLEGVRLGMTADALLTTRPNLKVREYMGWWEQRGDTAIDYGFGASLSGRTAKWEKLRRVAVIMEFSSDSVARAHWATLRDELTTRFRSAPVCEHIRVSDLLARLTWMTDAGRYRLTLGTRRLGWAGTDSVTPIMHALDDPVNDPRESMIESVIQAVPCPP